MSTIASRDLRNHTAEVLRRVAAGDHVTVTQHGAPVAEIGPVTSTRARSLRRAELQKILGAVQADAGLREDLAALADSTGDELGPIR
ncbi:type II toxin-antitoxin system Phd/YefM family antitoxin [Isoptericola rhizosphaerae]|uniref:type II toxin-antitoxin system Phd/YefM family antitoxin n=1 Tax=Isoptericola rhizosphaerae TaxID=3377837 RepID=UPI00383BDD92